MGGGIINSPRLSVRPSVHLSVQLSVACLDITREQKGLGSPNLAGWKPITRVTSEYLEVKRSKVRVTRPGPINVRQIETVRRAIETAQYIHTFIVLWQP